MNLAIASWASLLLSLQRRARQWHLQSHLQRPPHTQQGWPGLAASDAAFKHPAGQAASSASNGTCAHRARALRVVHLVDSHLPAATGRMRITGRLADVCAELERLAAREALRSPPGR